MPDTAIPFLQLIQREAVAGDPRCQQTVLVFCDFLEERYDPRADWLRHQVAALGCDERHHKRGNEFCRFCDTPSANRPELSRRVMEAMTRKCETCFGPGTLQAVSDDPTKMDDEGARGYDSVTCPACHGTGFLLTEAERCHCWPPKPVPQPSWPPTAKEAIEYAIATNCHCAGKGWRIKGEPAPGQSHFQWLREGMDAIGLT